MRCLLVLAVLLVALAVAQEEKPLLKGQYEDTVCNGIPFSNGYFQKRTVYYGYPQSGVGTYSYEQDVFADDSCSRESRLYQYRMTGTYDLNEQSTEVQEFWNIDYFIQSATLRVLDMQLRDHLALDTQCGLDRLSLGRYYDVSDARCSRLHIAPLDECRARYDIVRKDNNRVYVGAQYGGEPFRWIDNCSPRNRLDSYDHFGLAALDLYEFEEIGQTASQDLDDNRLGIGAIASYNGSSTLIASLATVFAALLVLM